MLISKNDVFSEHPSLAEDDGLFRMDLKGVGRKMAYKQIHELKSALSEWVLQRVYRFKRSKKKSKNRKYRSLGI